MLSERGLRVGLSNAGYRRDSDSLTTHLRFPDTVARGVEGKAPPFVQVDQAVIPSSVLIVLKWSRALIACVAYVTSRVKPSGAHRYRICGVHYLNGTDRPPHWMPQHCEKNWRHRFSEAQRDGLPAGLVCAPARLRSQLIPIRYGRVGAWARRRGSKWCSDIVRTTHL